MNVHPSLRRTASALTAVLVTLAGVILMAPPASAATTYKNGCDYDSGYESVTYGRGVVAVQSELNTCKYTVYNGNQRLCSYITINKLSSRVTGVYDNRIYLRSSGSHYRLMSQGVTRWPSGNACSGQIFAATFVYGGDYKLIRSFAKDLYASPRMVLKSSADQYYLENASQVYPAGSWTFWT